jgi:hypothetical protein
MITTTAAATGELTELFVYRRLTPGEVASYRDQGYLLYGPVLTARGLELMRDECMRAWTAEKGPFDPAKTWTQNALLSNIHQLSPSVRQLYFDGPMVDAAEQVIGPNVKCAHCQLTFKMRGNTRPFLWHQDNGYGALDPYNSISCLVALDDADLENGCLWVIPGSHRGGQIDTRAQLQKKDRPGDAGVEVLVAADESKAVPVPMRAGECLFFHCWTLHKSDGNASDRDRRIVFLRYADADAVEVYNGGRPRIGRLVRGQSRFPEVAAFER